MNIVLTIIALQQGLFAVGWWVAGSLLGLSRAAAWHWAAAALGTAAALVLILQRLTWHALLTIGLANLLAAGAFILVRRGLQVFLHLPTTDRESAILMLGVAAALGLYVAEPVTARVAVLAPSALIAWTLLRCALEAGTALRHAGERTASRIAALPLASLGTVYVLRVLVGLLWPHVGARPVRDMDGYNGGVVVIFLMGGLVLNMVLAYLVANRLVRQLLELSIRDPLTGLLNRRGLAPRLVREAARLRRYGEGYAVLALDLDHFKAVNDQHGHAAGDRVLSQLAGILTEAARDVDTAARLGGEEFCLVLSRSDRAGACQVAERLCAAVRQAAWPQIGPPVTISIGVALADVASPEPAAVMARADAAMMRAKQAGRDCVVVADPAADGAAVHADGDALAAAAPALAGPA